MIRPLLAASFALALVAGAAVPADAATQCRDAKGKFIKCPAKHPAAAHCKHARGKFVECSAPGAKAVP